MTDDEIYQAWKNSRGCAAAPSESLARRVMDEVRALGPASARRAETGRLWRWGWAAAAVFAAGGFGLLRVGYIVLCGVVSPEKGY